MPSFTSSNFGAVKQRIDQAGLSVANAARDGTGTIVDIVTAAAYGTSVTSLEVNALGTTTAGMVRVFLHNGVGYKLIKEILVSAITPSATVEAFSTIWTPSTPILIPNGYKLGISTEKAEAFSVVAKGLDY